MESKDRPHLWHSSHASIRLGDNVYEAVFFLGVRKISIGEWVKKNNVSFRMELDVPEDKVDDLKAFMNGSIGVPYSFMELFGILYTRFVKRFFKKNVKNPFNILKRKVKCTEFILESVKIFMEINSSKDINNIGVLDLEFLIREAKYKAQKAKSQNIS
jgi:endonuclease III-like uncharacterized protein